MLISSWSYLHLLSILRCKNEICLCKYFAIDFGCLQTIILNTFNKKNGCGNRHWPLSHLFSNICLMQHTQNLCPQDCCHEDGWRKLWYCLKFWMAWFSLQQVFTFVWIRQNVCKIAAASHEVGSIHKHNASRTERPFFCASHLVHIKAAF